MKIAVSILILISLNFNSKAQVVPQGFLIAPVVIESVTIGSQVWMKNNLDVKTYKNGDEISQVVSNISTPSWASYGTNATSAWTYNNYDANNNDAYGKLYNWYAVNDNRGICPVSWHIPSEDEWLELANFSSTDVSIRGKYLKEVGTTHWATSSSALATNTTGFSALGGGYMGGSGSSSGSLTYYGYFWSSKSNGSTASYFLLVDNQASFTLALNGNKTGGFSVRCIHD